MRDEYAEGRERLWQIIDQMWRAESFSSQLKSLQRLEAASNSIFGAAFPERADVLSLGLTIAPLTPTSVANFAKGILERAKPGIRVSEIGLAQKLAKDLRKQLLNSQNVLNRHLSKEERIDFGLL